MAILSAQLDVRAQQTATKAYDEKDKTVQTRLTETWVVETNAYAHVLEILAASGLPTVGAFYTFGTDVYRCMSVKPGSRNESPYAYAVTVDYESPKLPETGTPGSDEKWAVSIDIDGEPFQQPAYKALDDDDLEISITNSAQQGFENQPVEVIYDERITIRYKTLSGDSEQFATLRGKCNESTVTFDIRGMEREFEPRHLMCVVAKMGSASVLDDEPIWDVEIVLLARKDDEFTEHILDQGFCELVDDELVPCTSPNGDQLNSPCRLDGEGARIPDAAGPDAAVFLDFKIIKEADLTLLFEGLE